ncbi:MAG: GNAT family N-acetyltransferase [Amnibacterium sp.]
MAGSIAFATDLAARRLEGGSVEAAAGYRIVATPANPAFRWGSFVLADRGADLSDPERWAAVHRAAFPAADFTTIGIDDADPHLDEATWRAAGFEGDRSAVLRGRASAVAATEDDVVPIEGDADWADVLAISLEDGPDEPDSAAFARARIAAERAAALAGREAWLGVREGGRIVATLGVLPALPGVARYQNVGTLAAFRRRGHAGRLVRAAARLAAERWGCDDLVIVAETDGPAIGLYRRLGFRDAEVQLGLTRRGRP